MGNQTTKITIRRDRAFSARRGRTGVVLVTVLVLTAVLALVLGGIILLNRNLSLNTTRRLEKTEGVHMADAGVDLTVAWLESQPYPPDDVQAQTFNGNFFGVVSNPGGGATINAPFGDAGTSLTVRLYNDSANASSAQKRYIVESKSVMPSGAVTIVRAYLQQKSFGQYAFFTDNDDKINGFWDRSNHFEGPFHSNGTPSPNSNGASEFHWRLGQNDPPDTLPIFLYQGSGAYEGTVAPFFADGGRNADPPQTDADYYQIAVGGQASISINPNNRIDLPQTDYMQEYVALGLTPPTNMTGGPTNVPTRTGLTVTPGGGIFVHGDSESVKLSVDAANNQVFTVVTHPTGGYTLTQTAVVSPLGTVTTSVLKDGSNNTIPPNVPPANLYPNGTPANGGMVAGVSNGVLFSDSNINSISGTIANNTLDAHGNIVYRNQWNIATDTSSANGATPKNIVMTDSIVYKTQRATMPDPAHPGQTINVPQATDTNYNQSAGTLGIMTHNLSLSNDAPANIMVNADIFCTGTYQAGDPYANPHGQVSGTMTETGGVIVNQSGLFATANGNTIASGWNENYHYDTRLADHPPPYFPTTGNHYTVNSYQTVLSML